MKTRCEWCLKNELYIDYHDKEWGVPLHDDQKLFEFLLLEGVQAGLSWLTVLRKRENYRKAYDDFDPVKVAVYDEAKLNELLQNEGLIRNRLKIAASVNNAKCFLEVQKEFEALIATSGRLSISNQLLIILKAYQKSLQKRLCQT